MCNENCKDCKCGEADVAFATVENINVEISKLETDLTNVQFALDKNNETHKQLLLTQVKLEAALAALKHVRGDKSNV